MSGKEGGEVLKRTNVKERREGDRKEEELNCPLAKKFICGEKMKVWGQNWKGKHQQKAF